MFSCLAVRPVKAHIALPMRKKTLGELLAHFGAASSLTSGLDTC